MTHYTWAHFSPLTKCDYFTAVITTQWQHHLSHWGKALTVDSQLLSGLRRECGHLAPQRCLLWCSWRKCQRALRSENRFEAEIKEDPHQSITVSTERWEKNYKRQFDMMLKFNFPPRSEMTLMRLNCFFMNQYWSVESSMWHLVAKEPSGQHK